MIELHCNAEGCTKTVLTYRPVDFGLGLVFCTECAVAFINADGMQQLQDFNGEIRVHPSRDDA